MAEFKDRLNKALILRNMTAAELSRLSAVNEGAISQYKKGAYKATQENLERLAKTLNVSIPWLMGADVPMQREKTSDTRTFDSKAFYEELLNRFNEKLTKFKRATKRLEEALAEYEEYAVSSCRDGVIQRFEFCTELAWKSTREYLIEEGYVEFDSPRSVMRQAYSSGLITDEQAWLDLLFSRSKTSHIYDEATADDIFKSIKDKYLVLFKELAERLDK